MQHGSLEARVCVEVSIYKRLCAPSSMTWEHRDSQMAPRGSLQRLLVKCQNCSVCVSSSIISLVTESKVTSSYNVAANTEEVPLCKK